MSTSTAEDLVSAFLVAEWHEGLRLTTIPQAMARLGLPDDDETRWRVSQRLERAWRRRLRPSGLWRGLRWLRISDPRRVRAWLPALGRMPALIAEARAWNPAVYTLSNDEKRIARHILRVGRVPWSEEITAALNLDRLMVEAGLHMLARLGFLSEEKIGRAHV